MTKLNAALLEKGDFPDKDSVTWNRQLPEKAIQFGQGNFMRGYLDWMLHQMNKKGLFNGNVVVVQPASTGTVIPKLNEQDGLYTVILRGMENGAVVDKSEVITSISRGLNARQEWHKVLEVAESTDLEFVFSNTTEAGITYVCEDYHEGEVPESFPGKLTVFLYHRYNALGGDKKTGLTIVPCELVDENGKKLKELVLKKAEDWKFPGKFAEWIERDNQFCDTLVDRIVTGFPKEAVEEFNKRLGYEDEFITLGEPYHMLAIEAPRSVKEKLPFHEAGLNVFWEDIKPHRELKVRLLNGPHTMMFSVAFLYGVDTVLEVMENDVLSKFVELAFSEISPTVLADEKVKEQFIEAVKERFLNPYNKHYLTDIGLNAVFKYRARLLPTLKRYVDLKGELPQAIVFSLAAMLSYIRPDHEVGGELVGIRNGVEYAIRDNGVVLEKVTEGWNCVERDEARVKDFVTSFLSEKEIWGEDLTEIPGLSETVTENVTMILKNGMESCVKKLVGRPLI
ncbi:MULTISPECIES: tagaturonate reductase [Bacillaceae]|uniref:Tagaturonate reductase n=1 Tax=Evansella alkalicola TaxID=745819 RepID=A0ABS6JYB2_9BACI|nr:MULTISPECIES: tagaturonate reductase [Bacillaceae]MBU9723574.1 tagaturonate reductase [Bacillus alkalicola]